MLGLLLKCVFLTFRNKTCHEKGDTHESHVVHELIGLGTWIGLRLEEIKVHLWLCYRLCKILI